VVDDSGEYYKAKKLKEGVEIHLHPKNTIFLELVKAMIDAIKAEEIYTHEEPQELMDRQLHHEEKCAGEMTLLHKVDVKKWVEGNDFQCSFFGTSKVNTGLPDCLDKNSPEHSIELGIAIEAWQRFYGLGLTHPRDYFEKWLKEMHGTTLSNNAIERIITLINWNHGGGVKTEGFKEERYEEGKNRNITNFSKI
jgi:hypothetical protein